MLKLTFLPYTVLFLLFAALALLESCNKEEYSYNNSLLYDTTGFYAASTSFADENKDTNITWEWATEVGWSFYSKLIVDTSKIYICSGLDTSKKSSYTIPLTEVAVPLDAFKSTVTYKMDSGITYIIDGYFYVGEGKELIIKAGAVLKFKEGSKSNASALIIGRGGKIIAEGEIEAPIIMTAYSDNGNNLTASDRGLWGGVIILGKASCNTTGGTDKIEGIIEKEGMDISYGGWEDDDNSGVLKYVSIRHTGKDIGEGNEINGLTLAGVGRGTEIHHVEVIASNDDGVEWFGGTVNVKHLIVASAKDDALDFDQGYNGGVQYVIVHQAPFAANNAVELDGSSTTPLRQPFTHPVLVDCTFCGVASGKAVDFRRNAAGEFHRSNFRNFGKGVYVEWVSKDQAAMSSFDQWKQGNLVVKNNSFGFNSPIFTLYKTTH